MRMHRMRAVVQENNIYRWAADIIAEMAKLEFGADDGTPAVGLAQNIWPSPREAAYSASE
jgi:trehalose-6-phosphate synthase